MYGLVGIKEILKEKKKKRSYGHFAYRKREGEKKKQLCISGALLSCVFFGVFVLFCFSFHFGCCLLGQKKGKITKRETKRLDGIDKPFLLPLLPPPLPSPSLCAARARENSRAKPGRRRTAGALPERKVAARSGAPLPRGEGSGLTKPTRRRGLRPSAPFFSLPARPRRQHLCFVLLLPSCRCSFLLSVGV